MSGSFRRLHFSPQSHFPENVEAASASSLPAVRQHLIFRRSSPGVSADWAYEVDGGISPGVIIPMPSERYNGLFCAIRLLGNDEDLEDEAVDLETAHDAWKVLSAIESRNLPAPQIFS